MNKKWTKMTTDTLGKFILSSEDNLHIAATVVDVWPEIRQQIVAGFLASLETRLKKKLKGWNFSQDGGPFFLTGYAGYYFDKPAWAGEYSLGLQANEHGSRMIFGVCLGEHLIGERSHSNELLDAIKSIYQDAHTNKWWDARVFMQSPAADWRKPDVLWRMKRDSKFLDEVEETLLEVARVSEPIIAGLVRKRKK